MLYSVHKSFEQTHHPILTVG